MNRLESSIKKYYENPNHCKYCGVLINIGHMRLTITTSYVGNADPINGYVQNAGVKSI